MAEAPWLDIAATRNGTARGNRMQGGARWFCGIALAMIGAASVDAAEELAMSPSLASSLNRSTTTHVVSGRIVATSRQLGGRLSNSSKLGTRAEQLRIDLTSLSPSIFYEQQNESFTLTVEIRGGRTVRARLTPVSESDVAQVVFAQSDRQPIELAIGRDGETETFLHDSLWQLILEQPKICEEHLIPILELWRPAWHLMETGREIEAVLYQEAARRRNLQREQWIDLIEQLGSERYSARQAASRKLRRSGPAVLPFLRGLEPSELDAEQWFRVRRLIAGLSATNQEDSPQRAAVWLASDPKTWIALLSRDDGTRRRVAAEQIEILLGRPIRFDPDADAAVREEQITSLRAELQGDLSAEPVK